MKSDKQSTGIIILGLIILIISAIVYLENQPKEVIEIKNEPVLFDAKMQDAQRSETEGLINEIKCNYDLKLVRFTLYNPLDIPLKLNLNELGISELEGVKVVLNQVEALDLHKMCGKEVLETGESVVCTGTFGNIKHLRNKFEGSEKDAKLLDGGVESSNNIAVFIPSLSQHVKIYCH